MELPPAELQELKLWFGEAELAAEGGTAYIRFPRLKLPAGCDPAEVRALLCPFPRDGYPSRLFLGRQIIHSGPGKNWNAAGVVILGESWWAVSWHTKQTSQ